MTDDAHAPPPWDEDKAKALIGALVLIGLNEVGEGETTQTQMYGRVIAAERGVGVTVALEGVREGETFSLPPDLGNFHPAIREEYRLRSTGEVVSGAEWVGTWTVRKGAG
ncbi:MAG: hypothetical protein JWM33_2517 [Caulobacteraceae bacterium]|nr:hypothetical protein [Caulobacteraceae bacterium]